MTATDYLDAIERRYLADACFVSALVFSPLAGVFRAARASNSLLPISIPLTVARTSPMSWGAASAPAPSVLAGVFPEDVEDALGRVPGGCFSTHRRSCRC